MSTLQLPDKFSFRFPCRISIKLFISSLFILYLLFPLAQWAQTASAQEMNTESYLVQFSDISLSELVRFVSEMTGKNFVYSEKDLEARITVTADQPITSENLFSLLLRVLHVNRLEVFQEANHFLIFPSGKSKSADPIVSAEDQLEHPENLLLTKVFHIKYANLKKVKDLIIKIVSPTALVEIFENAHCLIVNDIYDNIQKVNELLMDIDKEDVHIVFETYFVKTMPAETLKSLANLAIPPFTKDFDTKIISNPDVQALHIVTTKALIASILKVLEGIDLQHAHLQPMQQEAYLESEMMFGEKTASDTIVKSLQNLVVSLQKKIAAKQETYDQLLQEQENEQSSLADLQDQNQIKEIEQPDSVQIDPSETTKNQEKLPPLTSEEEPFTSPEAMKLKQWQIEANFLQEQISERAQKLVNIRIELDHLQQELETITKYLPKEMIENVTVSEELNESSSSSETVESEKTAALQEEVHHLQRQLSLVNTEHSVHKTKSEKIGEKQLYAYRIQYKEGKELLKTIQDLSVNLSNSQLATKNLIGALQTSQFVEASNQLLFLGDPYTLERVQDILNILDVPTRQVLVELLVIDASIEKALEFGIDVGALLRPKDSGQWAAFGGNITQNSGLANALSSVGDTVPGDWGSIGSGLSSGVIGRFITYQGKLFATLGSLVHALSADGNVHVLMNPKILSEENKVANFFVGETTRIKINTQQSSSGAGLIVSGYEIRDIGSSIQVTPKINNDHTISLSIRQEISDSNQLAQGESDLSAVLPLTKTSRTTTEVLVPNRGFVVLSGMTHEKTRKTRATLPFLGSIPFISALFSKSVHTTDRRNMLVFIRAQIIHDAQETRALLEETRKFVINEPLLPKSFEERFNLFSPPIS